MKYKHSKEKQKEVLKKYVQRGYAEKGVYVETLDEEIDLSEDGRVKAIKTQQGGNKSFGELREMHGASPEALAFAEGGSLGNHGLKQGDQIIKTMSGGVQKVKTKSGDIVYVNLANGYRGDVPPLPFNNGGGVKQIDLFQHYDKQPKELSEIVNAYMEKFDEGDYDYEDNKNFLKEVESVGYTFDYGLDNEPYALRPIGVKLSQVEGYEDMDDESGYFNKGGRTRERKYVNYSQKHEVRYSKDKPHRRGYGYAEGGFMTDPNFGNFQNQVYAKGGAVYRESKYLTKEQWEKWNDYVKTGKIDGKKENNMFIVARHIGVSVAQIDLYEREKYKNYATGGVTKNYINRKQLNTITVKKGDQKLTYKVSDVYNGAYKLEDGGNLEKMAFYIPKRNVVKVQLRDGKDVKVANGYWIKKGAKPIHTSKYDDGGEIKMVDGVMYEKVKFTNGIEDFYLSSDLHRVNFYCQENGLNSKNQKDFEKAYSVVVKNKKFVGGGKTNTIEEDELMKKNGIVLLQGSPTISGQILARKNALKEIEKSEKAGESDVYPSMLERWKKNHKETIKKLEELKKSYAGGGKTTFNEKATAIAKNFEGKKVEPKYQKEYGKTYDKAEAKEVGNKIAGSQKAKYDSKMSGGGSTTKRGGAMVLAKQIRKDGESWQSALKRANEQIKKK